MNKIFLVPPMFLVLTLIPAATFAHRSDSIINSYSGYQQTCFNDHCAQGYTDGENQAYSDWSGQQKNDYCPTDQPHTRDYCSQFMLGYNDEWSRSVQQNFNTDQTQGASVNIHGNNNKVNIEQGQQTTSSSGSGGSINPECRAVCSNIG